MKVLVIGTLGELVKKAYELELALEKEQNQVLISELSSIQLILEEWPVDDKHVAYIASHNLRLALAQLHSAEHELFNLEETSAQMFLIVTRYAKCLHSARHYIGILNDIGKFVGSDKVFTIGDRNEIDS